MAYENIGTPSGNNLYITIPVRGTKNWDEKIKDGFFQKVSDHDHTPGKGARITLPALDSTLQNAIAQVSTNTVNIAQNAVDINDNTVLIAANTSNISSNDTDIAALDTRLSTAEFNIAAVQSDYVTVTTTNALDTRLTTAESNISSNDTDIAALDTRLTTAESNISSNDTDISALDTRVTTLEGSSSSSSYTLNNTNAQSDLPSYLSNADVLIDTTVGTTISNKEFENVRFSLDARITFQNCTFRNCFIGEGDNVAVPYHLSLTDSTAYSTEIMGMATVNIDRTNFYRGSIKARTLEIDNTTATSLYVFANNFVNVNDNLNIISNSSYITEFHKNDVRCSATTFFSTADDKIDLTDTKLDTLRINSDGYFLRFVAGSPPTIIVHEDGGSIPVFNLRDSLGTTIASLSGGMPAFKIVDGTYSIYDKGLVPSGTPSNGDTLIYNAVNGEWELTASGGYYVIDSVNDLANIPTTSAYTGPIHGVTLNFSYNFFVAGASVPNTYTFRDCHIISENSIEIQGSLDSCVVHCTNTLTIHSVNRCAIIADSINQKDNINYSLIQCKEFNFNSASDILPDTYLRYSKLSCKNFVVSHSYTNNRFYKIIDCNIEASLYAYLTGATYTSTPSMFVETSYIKAGSDLRLSNVVSTDSRFSGGFINTTLLGSFDGTAINNAYTTSNAIYDVELIEDNLFHSGTGATGSLMMQVADQKNISSTSANTEYEVLAAAADYNPNSLIVNTNQFEAPSAGVYVINVSCQFSSNASQGSSIYIYKNSTINKFINKSEPKFLATGDQVLTLASGDLINITISTSDSATHSIVTNYTIKKIS